MREGGNIAPAGQQHLLAFHIKLPEALASAPAEGPQIASTASANGALQQRVPPAADGTSLTAPQAAQQPDWAAMPASAAAAAGSEALPVSTASPGAGSPAAKQPTSNSLPALPSSLGQLVPAVKDWSSTAASAASSAAAAATSSSGGAPPEGAASAAGAVGRRLLHPSALLAGSAHHADRMIVFLATLASYPFMFLLAQSAAAAGSLGLAGVGGGGIDTRQRLADFPEGAALADLESWCHESAFLSWWHELLVKGLRVVRQLLLTFAPHDIVRQLLFHPRLLQLLQLHPGQPLARLVDDLMPRARQLMADGSPQVALAELQQVVVPGVASLKASLEQRVRLARSPTPLERLDFITSISRTASFVFFSWLRGLARLATYTGSVLSVVSGALSFTVVPSIILSVLAAAAGIGQLLLTGTADLLEPAVNGLLALTETSKDKAASFTGAGSSPVCSRQLPSATVEQLEGFFESQLTQVSGLLNRPEIPRLAGHGKALLVKAYDLGLIDATGATEARAVRELLQEAQAQGTLAILLSGLYNACKAAAAVEVGGVAAAASSTARSLSSSLLPAALGGRRNCVRSLFRPDGFFAYADERTAQAALVLLCRLLSWLHLASVVAPGSADCLRFVLLIGEAQSGKASLFSQLVSAPAEFAAQLGGAGSRAAEAAATDQAPVSAGEMRSKQQLQAAAANPGGAASRGSVAAPAVDLRPVAGQRNMYAAVFPGLNSRDAGVSRLSQGLATALGGLASAVVFLVHPRSEPSPDKLALLEGPLAAGRHCLVAVNGPSRRQGLLQAAGRGLGKPAATAAAAGEDAGPGVPAPQTPLEELRQAWQVAAEAFCAQRGLSPSLLGVVVSELQQDAGELPPGVHKFKQVQDWIVSTANQAHRMA